jgi:glutamine amidotransferase
MIAIIDYGLGNIKAFANIYHKLDIPARIVKQGNDLSDATRIILPGVGAFDHAMKRLNDSGLRPAIEEKVLIQKIPALGVCVGMQMLAHSSEEGHLPGLGWINGAVKRFDPATLMHKTHLPHMGWNDVQPIKENSLFQGLYLDARFYFLHSYYLHCHNKEDILAVTDYGVQFTCAVNFGNIFGVQFHPEKSHHCGIQLLKNFVIS